MSEIDQAFIRAYQEAQATPPKRTAAPQARAGQMWRLDVPAAAPQAEGQAAGATTSRVPTPHLHFAARGAAWLERPQPQLVASVAQEFVAEEYCDEEVAFASMSDPRFMQTPVAPEKHPTVAAERQHAPQAMGPGFGGPLPPKMNPTPASPDVYGVFSGAIKPSAPAPMSMPQPLPVRPSTSGPWSPTAHIAPPKKAAPTGERIAFVEKHTEEMTQQLASVAHTLAMLEGSEPTEICLEKKEVTVVIRDADGEGDTLDKRVAEALEAKLASLAPPAPQPEPAIAATPAEPVAEVLEQVAEVAQMKIAETPEPAKAAPAQEIAAAPAPVAAPAKTEAAPVAEELPPAPQPVAAPEKFQPQWEVDQFQWPDVIDRLRDRAEDAIGQACDSLQSACEAGQKVLAITGVEESMGSTTLLLSLGRELGKRGMKVAIVDADFDRPTLAERTGLRIQHGWEATLTGSLPLEEVTVASLQDGVTLVPLVARQGVSSTMASLHAAKHLRRLRDHFDAVLIDAGVGSENVAALVTATADDALDTAVVLTVDERRSEPAATDEVVSRLRHCGINSIQIGETFVSA